METSLTLTGVITIQPTPFFENFINIHYLIKEFPETQGYSTYSPSFVSVGIDF